MTATRVVDVSSGVLRGFAEDADDEPVEDGARRGAMTSRWPLVIGSNEPG